MVSELPTRNEKPLSGSAFANTKPWKLSSGVGVGVSFLSHAHKLSAANNPKQINRFFFIVVIVLMLFKSVNNLYNIGIII